MKAYYLSGKRIIHNFPFQSLGREGVQGGRNLK
jgi:hypothetical protein